jgi:hypothetical protein
MKQKPTYDSRCYDLAETFLQDEPHWFEQSLQFREEAKAQLAALIQSTIEDQITYTIRPEIRK